MNGIAIFLMIQAFKEKIGIFLKFRKERLLEFNGNEGQELSPFNYSVCTEKKYDVTCVCQHQKMTKSNVKRLIMVNIVKMIVHRLKMHLSVFLMTIRNTNALCVT